MGASSQRARLAADHILAAVDDCIQGVNLPGEEAAGT
jgi:hypothetical protein